MLSHNEPQNVVFVSYFEEHAQGRDNSLNVFMDKLVSFSSFKFETACIETRKEVAGKHDVFTWKGPRRIRLSLSMIVVVRNLCSSTLEEKNGVLRTAAQKKRQVLSTLMSLPITSHSHS